jgi:hypothetical protein
VILDAVHDRAGAAIRGTGTQPDHNLRVLVATEPPAWSKTTRAALIETLGARCGRITVIGVALPPRVTVPWDPLSASLATSSDAALELAADTAKEIVDSLPFATSGRHLAVAHWGHVADVLSANCFDVLVLEARSRRRSGCRRLARIASRQRVPITFIAAGPGA